MDNFANAGVVILFVLVCVLACCMLALVRRVTALQEWREEIEAGKGEEYIDQGSFPAASAHGSEDWRGQVL